MRLRRAYVSLILCVLTILFHGVATAQDISTPEIATVVPTIAPTDTPEPTATPNVEPTPTDSTEVAVLKAQLAAMERGESQMLSTMNIWLAVMVLVATLAAGGSFAYNVVISERDKKALRKELNEKIEKSLTRESSGIEANLTSMLYERTDAMAKDLSDQVVLLSSESAREFAQLMDVFRMQSGAAIFNLKYDISRMMAKRWEEMGNFENAVCEYFDMIATIVNFGMYDSLGETLDRTGSMLDLVKYNGRQLELNASQNRQIDTAMNSIPPQYKNEYWTTIQTIAGKLNALRKL